MSPRSSAGKMHGSNERARAWPGCSPRSGAAPPAARSTRRGPTQLCSTRFTRAWRPLVDRPLVVVLEDVHWASSGTRDALAGIARTGGAIPVLLVATAHDDPHLEPETSRFIAELSRLPVVDVVALRGLDVDAAGVLIDEVGGHLDPAEAVRATGGNPLFLREMAPRRRQQHLTPGRRRDSRRPPDRR